MNLDAGRRAYGASGPTAVGATSDESAGSPLRGYETVKKLAEAAHQAPAYAGRYRNESDKRRRCREPHRAYKR